MNINLIQNMNNTDIWAWWRAALENPQEIGKSLPVHDSDPQPGYYRTKRKGAPSEPVAIYYLENSNELIAYRGKWKIDPSSIWTFCCRHPVTYQAYMTAESGGDWPDDDAAVSAQIAPPAPGDNSGDVDEAEKLKDQIEAALAGADAYKAIKDDATATKALSLRNRLNELSNTADKFRETLKKPHFEAGKAVDAKWQPLVKTAKGGADTIRDAMSRWESEKLAKQREQERQRAEELRKQQEANQPELPAGDLVEVQAPSSHGTIKPSYGKAASVSTKLVVIAVTDWKALALFMVGHPEHDDLLMKLAQRAVNAGKTVPGVTVEEQAVVR